jgi:nucleoid-associated protein YgaU
MSLQNKYQDVLALGQSLGVKNGNVEEADNVLKMWGTVATPYEKDQLWDKIKAVGGAQPTDIMADITVENTDFYCKHVVGKGDTLGKIAKRYLGDSDAYKAIFEANRDILKSPDMIQLGQELVIPNPIA